MYTHYDLWLQMSYLINALWRGNKKKKKKKKKVKRVQVR